LESPPVENRDGLNLDKETERIPSTSNETGKGKRVFFETKSLAEVYAKQGHISMALEIYKRIQKGNPSDQQIEMRISELKDCLSSKRGIRSKDQDE
jgi:hypothetical protein